MMIPATLDFLYRDYPGEYLPPIVEQLAELEQQGCYATRWVRIPDNQLEVLGTARPYLQYDFEIKPGSFIAGIKHNVAKGFNFQLSDPNLNLKLFSDPVPDYLLMAGNSTPTTDYGQWTYWLSSLYAVVAPGRFIAEWWNTSGAQINDCGLTLLVAEVR